LVEEETMSTQRYVFVLVVLLFGTAGLVSAQSASPTHMLEQQQYLANSGLAAGSPDSVTSGQPAAMLRQQPTPRPTATPEPSLDLLTAYNAPIAEAVAELEYLELIPSGGSEIFREPYAFFEGTGNWFTLLASHNPRTHVIIAGELTFRSGTSEDYESCSLLSRVTLMAGSTPVDSFLEVGFDNDGQLYAVQFVDGEVKAAVAARVRVNFTVPHHILYMAFRDRLTVYLDGERALEDVEIDERAGTYGVALAERGSDARCEGRNIWGWQVDEVVEFGDDCGVRAAKTVNLRAGPGTEFDRAGMLEAGQTELIVGQAPGEDGFVWWKLESGNWVRSDVVTAGGNCVDVPVVGE
jgi:hypothetical protein